MLLHLLSANRLSRFAQDTIDLDNGPARRCDARNEPWRPFSLTSGAQHGLADANGACALLAAQCRCDVRDALVPEGGPGVLVS